jgi:ATP-binding cassette subfamily B (MDR/TAP) protein 8
LITFICQSALAAAIVNIKIPLLLGELVNIVSNFTHDEAGNFIEEIKKPALKLVGYYSLQVCFI